MRVWQKGFEMLLDVDVDALSRSDLFGLDAEESADIRSPLSRCQSRSSWMVLHWLSSQAMASALRPIVDPLCWGFGR